MKRKMPPVHPGAILREDFLKEMKLSVTDAAKGLHISRKQLSKILNESASVTAEMAIRLQKAFDVPAEFWLDLQKDYDIWKVQESGRVHDIHHFVRVGEDKLIQAEDVLSGKHVSARKIKHSAPAKGISITKAATRKADSRKAMDTSEHILSTSANRKKLEGSIKQNKK